MAQRSDSKIKKNDVFAGKFSSIARIEDVCRAHKKDIKTLISNKYAGVNVNSAMRELVQLGDLLLVAYAAAGREKCSVIIIDILGSFQSLISNASTASGAFVRACLAALDKHRLAIKLFEKNKFESAAKILSKCSKVAKDMQIIAGKMVDESGQLCKLSQEGLKQAQSDKGMREEDKNRLEERRNASEAEQKRLTALYEDQCKALEISEEEQRIALKKVDEGERKNAISGLIKSMSLGWIDYGKTDVKFQQNRSAEAQKAAIEARLLTAKSNAALRKTLHELSTMTCDGDKLDQTIKSLEIVITSMGRVKTTFEKVKRFWANVEQHCLTLSKGTDTFKELTEAADAEICIEATQEQAMSWAALGYLNVQAQKSIAAALHSVDNAMTNLPTKDQVPSILKGALSRFDKTIKETEDMKLDNLMLPGLD